MNMKNIYILSLVSCIFLLGACAKTPGKSGAKIKVSTGKFLSGTGVGVGGVLLFGKHLSSGNSFGMALSSSEEVLDLPNGTWDFFAFAWEDSGGIKMKGKVYCGKSSSTLLGTDVVVNLSLSNANCSDTAFSGGKSFQDVGNVRFPKVYGEECDEVNANTTRKCGFENQGSGLSYRFVFRNYKRHANGTVNLGAEALSGPCYNTTNFHSYGFDINFPVGTEIMPFVGEILIYPGSSSCDGTDPKGFFTFILNQGIGLSAHLAHKVHYNNGVKCAALLGSDESKCKDSFRTWNGTCAGAAPDTTLEFSSGDGDLCSATVPSSIKGLKQIFSIPKDFLCGKYINNYTQVGTHPFAGGDGFNEIRPYKICTEWQLNQIGEKGTAGYDTKSFKLMNDLDMNAVDISLGQAGSTPLCANSLTAFERHHTLNPLDGALINQWICSFTGAGTGYTGTFNGNNKTINNARILTAVVLKDHFGLVRKLGTDGVVKNLKLKNLEVSTKGNYVGGIAGVVYGTVKNVILENEKIEGAMSGEYFGGVAGNLYGGGKLEDVHVINGKIRGGIQFIGGLAGIIPAVTPLGTINNSHFRGKVESGTINGDGIGAIGGLVGNNNGTISNSFSEGLIRSHILHSGGIVGNNNGTINNVYSTMVVSDVPGVTTVQRLGGLVGIMSAGSLTNAYFSGAVRSNGGGDSLASAYSAPTATNSDPTNKVYSNSSCNSLSTTDWTCNTNFPTRLKWEETKGTRECLLSANQLSVVDQISDGRGGLLNPVIICNDIQLKALEGGSSVYRLGDDIDLSLWTASTDNIGTFSGVLFGNDKILYGANLSGSQAGIFENLSGKIFNLNLIANSLTATSGSAGRGILSGFNTGTIKNVESYENVLTTGPSMTGIGIIAGNSSGVVSDILIDGGKIAGSIYVGGAVGKNLSEGIVKRVDVDTVIKSSGAGEALGGVVGKNIGVIDQVAFGGDMDLLSDTSATKVGGVVGYNSGGGIISNVMTENFSRILVSNDSLIGGVVGYNDGGVTPFLTYSLSLGLVSYENAGLNAGNNFHPIVGNLNYNENYNFFLQDHIGSKKASKEIASPGCNGSSCNTSSALSTIAFDAVRSQSINSVLTNFNSASGTDPTNSFFSTSSSFLVLSWVDLFFKHANGSSTSGSNDYGMLLSPAFSTLASFCNSWGVGGSCSSGFDIAKEDSYGHWRLMNFYKSYFDGAGTPANAPIWELEINGAHPTLLQLKRR